MSHVRPIARWIACLSLALAPAVVLPGCGSSEVGPGDFSQQFEEPDDAQPAVVQPPDDPDDLSPRERRALQK